MKYNKINLRLFDGEGTGASVGTGEGLGTGEGNIQSSDAEKIDLKKVVYGKQANVEPTEPTNNVTNPTVKTPEEKKAEFEALIKGDYKDIFAERTQSIIDNRFKETKTYESQLQQLNPVLTMMANRYGIDPSDVEGLAKAIESDDSLFEQEALDAGMTVEQYRQYKRMESENQAFKKSMQEQQARENANKTYQGWLQEAEQIQSFYPSFDLETEIGNKDFMDLLGKGIPLRTAYEVIHRDEIMGGALQYAVQQTQQQVVNNIKARGQRPTENGLQSNMPITHKKDVNALTKADREEIERRVLMNGEKVSF